MLSPDLPHKAHHRPLGEAVAVTGLGIISAAGTNLEEHREALYARHVNCTAVPPRLFSTSRAFPVFAVTADELTPAALALTEVAGTSQLLPLFSRTVQLAVSAAATALAMAGIDVTEIRGRRVGVALGTTVGCTFNDEPYYLAWRRGERPELTPVLRYLGGNLAQCLHGVLGTSGPAMVVTNACASGTDAIGLAARWVAHGLCDIALAGGADELSRIAYNGFASLMLYDTEPCRPFDSTRRGLNLGEGAGILLLENAEAAASRGARTIGRILGYAAAADAWHPTAPHPEGRGLQNALMNAIATAGLDKNAIALVNAHGTGTVANDQAETAALAAVFPDSRIPVVSTKGLTGHTLGAAGGIEAALTLVALAAGETPGTAGCMSPDPTLPYPVLPGDCTVKLVGNIGISQSLAFGGGNSTLILEAC